MKSLLHSLILSASVASGAISQTTIVGRLIGLDPAIADSVSIALSDGIDEGVYCQARLSVGSTFIVSSRETGGLILNVACPGYATLQAALLTIGLRTDTVEIHLLPVLNGLGESRIAFRDSTSLVAKYAALHMKWRHRFSTRYVVERRKFLETHGDVNGFTINWTEDAQRIARELQQESSPILRHELILQYLEIWGNSPDCASKDSLSRWIQEIPPESPAWCFNSPKYIYLSNGLLDTWPSYRDQMIARNSDRFFRANILGAHAQVAFATGDTVTFLSTLGILMRDYSDTKSALLISRLIHPFLKVGDTVPSFILRSMDDTLMNISSKELLGKTYLIDFWGTWCVPCIEQMPYLSKAYERFNEKGFTILSIALDYTSNVRNFRKAKWHMPWLNACISNDRGDATIQAFGVPHYPYPVLVNAQGTIIALDDELWRDRLEETLENYFQK